MIVFIPLGNGSKIDNWELRYMLRSLHKNLKCDYKIIICGNKDYKPSWLTAVEYYEIDRFFPSLSGKLQHKSFENYFDTLNKLKCLIGRCDDEKIAYMCDDQILLQPLEDLSVFEGVALYPHHPNKRTDLSKHEQTVQQALDLAATVKTGTLYNGETHLPRIYETNKLKQMFDTYKIETFPPYAPYTLYLNLFYDKPKTILEEGNVLKAGFTFEGDGIGSYIAIKAREIEEAAKDKLILNYNDKGLNAVFNLLKKWIESKFPEKSVFEL